MFNFFKKKKINQLYPELKPGDRIVRLIKEFLEPELSKQGFVFNARKMEFIKQADFFEYHIYFPRSKYNSGNITVRFDIMLSVFSDKYRDWEKKYYGLRSKDSNSINGTGAGYVKGWNKQYYNGSWYDLAEHDNVKLMNMVLDNLKTSGQEYFNNFRDIDSAINFLLEYRPASLEKIVDFFIITDRINEAKSFFESNRSWHEEQIKNADPYFMTNQLSSYELRKNKLAQL